MILATEPETVGCDGVLFGCTAATPAPPEPPDLEVVALTVCLVELLPIPAPPPAASAVGAPTSASAPRLGRMRFFTRRAFSFVGLRG
jgi:hypothetical protein